MPKWNPPNKPVRPELIPEQTLIAIAEVLALGADKYGNRGWMVRMSEGGQDAVDAEYGALMRHLWAWRQGEDADPETGKPHLAHAASRLLILLWNHLHWWEVTRDGVEAREKGAPPPLPAHDHDVQHILGDWRGHK